MVKLTRNQQSFLKEIYDGFLTSEHLRGLVATSADIHNVERMATEMAMNMLNGYKEIINREAELLATEDRRLTFEDHYCNLLADAHGEFVEDGYFRSLFERKALRYILAL